MKTLGAASSLQRACVFAHYDPDGLVGAHVLFYLQALREFVTELVFVSTAELAEEQVRQVEALEAQVVLRENIGYDFCSYKLGLAELKLANFSEVLVCNDSVFGPVFPLGEAFGAFDERPESFLGLTSSTELAPHLQSYFMLFRRPVLTSVAFKEFWAQVEPLESKEMIIDHYEVGLSRSLSEAGFSAAAIYETRSREWPRLLVRSMRYYLRTLWRRKLERRFWRQVTQVFLGESQPGVNTSHVDWKHLLLDRRMPFLKIELLRDNPKQIGDVQDWENLLGSVSDYPQTLIHEYLRRHARAKKADDC